jgi:mannose-1-phosphate guanylyltransferase
MPTGARAFVLAAGLGTRLRPLTDSFPKPAVPFLGAPLLRRTFAVLSRAGVDRVAVNTHHLPETMAQVAQEEGARSGFTVTTVHEPVIQGTGGGLRGLQHALPGDDAVIAWNGDILFAPDLGPMLDAHRRSGAAATMVLLPMPPGRSYGVVEIDAAGRVRRIGRANPAPLPGCTAWHFSGVHMLSPPVFEVMAPEGPEDINHDVYPRLFASGGVRGVVVDAAWSDLGSAATYLEAQADLLLGRIPDPLGPGSPLAGRTGIGALVEPGARVDPSADLDPDVFVASGVEVPAGALIRRSALLPGAGVEAGETVEEEIRWEGRRLSARMLPATEVARTMAESLNGLAYLAWADETLAGAAQPDRRAFLDAASQLRAVISRLGRGASPANEQMIASTEHLERLIAALEAPRSPPMSELRELARAFLEAAGFPLPSSGPVGR